MMRGGILTVSHDILVLFEFMEIILLAKSLIADLNMQIKFSIFIINATANQICGCGAT